MDTLALIIAVAALFTGLAAWYRAHEAMQEAEIASAIGVQLAERMEEKAALPPMSEREASFRRTDNEPFGRSP